MKRCTACKTEKPLAEFSRSGSSKDGYQFGCKQCRAEMQRQYRWRPEVRESRNASRRGSRRTGAEFSVESLMLKNARRYGISIERYLEMKSGSCEVCGVTERLEIDHDHACCPGDKSCGNCIRGVLCWRCNRAEGMLRNGNNARALAEYMDKHSAS